ncbi:MAG TPA: hypothetical protein VHB30_11620 [Solirubrobacteraceae bacterium]|nr:hypothetical protein [Solirubrobacteraceae bacterium]
MAVDRYVVLSDLSGGSSPKSFDEWFDAHVAEFLAIPGIVAAQSYELEPSVVDPAAPTTYRVAAIFEIERRPLDLPAWWEGARLASWVAAPIGECVTTDGSGSSARRQIVFSDPGPGVTDESLDTWYAAHVHEILSIPGFTAARRYRLEPRVVDHRAPIPQRRLAVYEVDRAPEELRAEMERLDLLSAGSYERLKEDPGDPGPPLPKWWPQVRFASWDLIPRGPRTEAVAAGSGPGRI